MQILPCQGGLGSSIEPEAELGRPRPYPSFKAPVALCHHSCRKVINLTHTQGHRLLLKPFHYYAAIVSRCRPLGHSYPVYLR